MEYLGWGLLALIVIIPLWGVALYNKLVNLRTRLKMPGARSTYSSSAGMTLFPTWSK